MANGIDPSTLDWDQIRTRNVMSPTHMRERGADRGPLPLPPFLVLTRRPLQWRRGRAAWLLDCGHPLPDDRLEQGYHVSCEAAL